MKTVLLKDGETSIETAETELTIYFKFKKTTQRIIYAIYLSIIALIFYLFNINVAISAGFFAGFVILSFHEVTELTFNKTNKQVFRTYSFFGKVKRTKNLLSNYDKHNYLIKLDSRSKNNTRETGYFFTAKLRNKNLYLYSFKTLEDANCAVEILNKELNLIQNQIDVRH